MCEGWRGERGRGVECGWDREEGGVRGGGVNERESEGGRADSVQGRAASVNPETWPRGPITNLLRRPRHPSGQPGSPSGRFDSCGVMWTI